MKPLASAPLNVDGEHDLADEVLTRIEERENEMRARLEKLNGSAQRSREASEARAGMRYAPRQ